jgi:hypothetical protein
MAKDKVIEDAGDEIVVNDPQILRPKVLPLVIELPASASVAQVEFAKILNAYAYKNPEKWAIKKEKLLAELKTLKNAPAPVEDPDRKLTIGTKNKLGS